MKRLLIVLAVLTVVGASIWFVIDGGQASENTYGVRTGTDVAAISDLQQNPAKYLLFLIKSIDLLDCINNNR